ncbi:MAG: mechanosensitive ion channel family protein, partial [Deltaproteobacteria bacterium]|nr:mechanosensitive ion channel family protein [Deltaproteobacteria bacterium]
MIRKRRIPCSIIFNWIPAPGLLIALLLCNLQLVSPVKASSLPENPLEPVNTSGPRATLRTFMTNADKAFAEFKQSGYRTKEALKYIQRAAGTLNMSHIPSALHEDVGFESTLQLKVILDNINLPDLNTVPEAKDFKGSEDRFWRIPHSDITIARVSEGRREGAWLFSTDTVSQIGTYYRLIKERRGKDRSFDPVYEKYIYSSGWMIPAGLIDSLPRWMRTGIYEQALWQWVGLLLTLMAGAVTLIGSWRASNWLKSRLISDSRRWQPARLIYPAFAMLVASAALYLIDSQLNITGRVLYALGLFLKSLILVFASWAILVAGDIVNEGIAGIRRVESTTIASDVTRLVIRVISFIIIFILLYNAAEHSGIPVHAVLASAGIAGFAVAMAAKDTLSNLFGGVAIFMDRPFRPGDYIVLDDNERGKVVHIGLRSTRIQTRDDVMITIPNSIITNTKIVNQSSPTPIFRVRIKIGVAYGSDIKQVETILVQQVRSNPLAAQYPEPRARFRKFGDSSLDFELLCWVKRPQDRGRFMHGLNSAIYNAFAEAGIKIPFPQRDVHLTNEQ